jgi:chaperonin GroEL (HSP60 family)
VIDNPRVLVSAEPIMAIRELISVLEHMIADHTALIVVAPTLSSEVLDTLVVNHLQRMIDLVAVVTRDPIPVDAIVEATGATLISRIDLQNGYVSDQHLGRCERWVSDRKASYIVPEPS